MEGLLAGIEDGETPAWARPAVDELMLARRGMSASSVGRDSLFNALFKVHQLQKQCTSFTTKSSQNLSNEQQTYNKLIKSCNKEWLIL